MNFSPWMGSSSPWLWQSRPGSSSWLFLSVKTTLFGWVLILFGVCYHKRRPLQLKNLLVTSSKDKSRAKARPRFGISWIFHEAGKGFEFLQESSDRALSRQLSSFIFIREWEWNSKHSDLEFMYVTLSRVMGSVFFQWETLITNWYMPVTALAAPFWCLLIVAYSSKNLLTIQVASGSRFQSKSDL